MTNLTPEAPLPYIVTRQHDWPSGRRRIEIAVGVEAISPDALAYVQHADGTPRYPQEWSQHTNPLVAVQAAIRLQTALYRAGDGYWPLVLSSSAVVQAHPIRRRAARRWALRVRAQRATLPPQGESA
ncbi:MAG: hypothetical protein M3Z04_09740 [Chloroflexota bacterium]|nr:hypothetical protein [Chloroflexota bacterium]